LDGEGKVLTSIKSWLPDRVIVGNIDNPKGLIGVYERQLPDGTWIRDTKNALEELNFPETFASTFVDASKDGFKMLNTNQFYWTNPDQFWNEFNTPWLNGLKNSGADVVVLSDKSNIALTHVLNPDNKPKMVNGQFIKTGFGKEIEFMETLVEQGLYQWDEIKGLYKYIGN
jgi:hypothetical protein